MRIRCVSRRPPAGPERRSSRRSRAPPPARRPADPPAISPRAGRDRRSTPAERICRAVGPGFVPARPVLAPRTGDPDRRMPREQGERPAPSSGVARRACERQDYPTRFQIDCLSHDTSECGSTPPHRGHATLCYGTSCAETGPQLDHALPVESSLRRGGGLEFPQQFRFLGLRSRWDAHLEFWCTQQST